MKKLLAFMLMTFVATAPLSAKDAVDAGNKTNTKTASEKQAKEPPGLVSFGTNLSSFQGEDGQWQLGYSLGLTFNIHIYRNLSMTLPISYTRINAAPENVKDRNFPDPGESIYRILIDWQVSVGFFEVPALFTYKFITKSSYDIRYLLGAGLVVAKKDYSKIENITKTDEIIGVERYGHPLEPQHSLDFPITSISTGIRGRMSNCTKQQPYLSLLIR